MTFQRASLAAALVGLAVAGLVAGCATQGSVRSRIEENRANGSKPTRNVTSFGPALRCMDELMLSSDVGSVSVLMEDLTDRTGEVKAGTRDMVIAAVSDMTRRSHAIRINAFGNDSGNLVSYIAAAGRQSIYEEIPPLDLRGSVSQMDKGIVSEQADAGVGLEYAGLGASVSASGSVMGLDLSMISTDDLTVVPGVYTRNAIVILKSGRGVDLDATINTVGVNFSLTLAESEGTAQALRSLIELSSIEIFGRLFMVPYWSCLGIPSDHEDVQREISDWFQALHSRGELVRTVQTRLRARGFFRGRASGFDSPSFRRAVARYRAAAGLPDGEEVDPALFRSLLTDTELRAPAEPAPAPPTMEIRPSRERFARGEPVELDIRTGEGGYLSCFYTDEQGRIVRFFPNRFHADGYVAPESALELPGTMPFEITASERGASETVDCFLTDRDVLPELPASIRSQDFEALDSVSITELRRRIAELAGGRLDQDELKIHVER